MATILLAESDCIVGPVLASILTRGGHRVLTAQSTQQVVAVLGDQQPELILFDLDMPRCGGVDAVRYVTRLQAARGIKILGLTHHSDRVFLTDALRAGVRAILLKEEYSPKLVLERVAQLLAPVTPPATEPKCSQTVAKNATKGTATAAADDVGVITEESTAVAAAPVAERPAPLTLARIEEAVSRIAGAKALRPIVQQVIAMAANPNTEIQQVTSVLRNDLGLSAKVIAAANSAFYRRKSGSVTTLAAAVSIIGLGGTRDLAMSLGVAETFAPASADAALALPGLWGHSIAVAHFCEAMARRRESGEPEQSFIVGLLHDIGRRVMAEHFPEHYRHVLATTLPNPATLCQLEQTIVGADHALVGSIVTDRWGCPAFIGKAIRAHHTPTAGRDIDAGALGALAGNLLLADAMAISFGYEGDALEELPVVPRGLLGRVPEAMAFREQAFMSLQELLGLIMSRADLPVLMPGPWQGQIEQLVVLGALPHPLEPLQHLIAHAYRGARVVAPANADLSQPSTLLLTDLRGTSSVEGAATALAWLDRARAPASWPLLIVTSMPADAMQKALTNARRTAVLAPPLRTNTVKGAVQALVSITASPGLV